MHLTGYLISVAMFLVGVLSLPIASIDPWAEMGVWGYVFLGLLYVSLLGPIVAHAYSRRVLSGAWRGTASSPSLMLIGLGLCLSTSLACLSGLVRRGGEFRRTPKQGRSGARHSRYRIQTSPIWLAEVAAAVYCAFTLWHIGYQRAGLHGIFIALFAIGFAVVGWLSSPFADRSTHRDRLGAERSDVPDALPVSITDS